MPMNEAVIGQHDRARQIRVTGLVQGVGFRPTVWRLAQRHGLRGTVCNDGEGVAIHVCGPGDALVRFISDLRRDAPPLARVDRIDCHDGPWLATDAGFAIVPSTEGLARTAVAPDAASCAACIAETLDPAARRHRYAFTNCTHCGPRLSITTSIPYDRAHTTMQAFTMCQACRAEYENPADRRFHAQPIACPDCGPHVWLETGENNAADGPLPSDAITAAQVLLQRGAIVAIKGLGGFQLACAANNREAVARLRTRKLRATKPLALMARDLAMVRAHAQTSGEEEALLQSTAAPIVLLQRVGAETLPGGVAPGMSMLGFMLPNTPLHHLLLRALEHPIVLSSGNLSDAPQQTDNHAARAALAGIADAFLMHDRPIARRVDDSVLRMMAGAARVLRRARGLAPAPIALHPAFAAAAPVLAMGADLKNSFCLLRAGQAVMSHHIGELREPRTLADYRRAIEDYRQLFDHQPAQIAIDRHPQSLAGSTGRAIAVATGATVVEVQHHHAHIAACLAENGVAPDTPPVLGIALDGSGYGDDGSIWGGEFLRADYRGFARLARLQPVVLPGGDAAMREPWRNTYAQLVAAMGWPAFAERYPGLELLAQLQAKPRDVLDAMLASGVNSPLASSAARLFDAVAAACGICFDSIGHEGQAAMQLEACVDTLALEQENDARAYPFAIDAGGGAHLPCIVPAPIWPALFDDLHQVVPVGVIAARFHKGMAIAIVRMVQRLRAAHAADAKLDTVVLSGGVFQNRILLEQLVHRLGHAGLTVLTHRQVPANDGGIALGQAAVAAARALAHAGATAIGQTATPASESPCA